MHGIFYKCVAGGGCEIYCRIGRYCIPLYAVAVQGGYQYLYAVVLGNGHLRVYHHVTVTTQGVEAGKGVVLIYLI